MKSLRNLLATAIEPKFPAPPGGVAAADPAFPGNRTKSTSEESGELLKAVSSLREAGSLAEALAFVVDGLASAPENPALLFARASVLFDWGRYREARDGYLRAGAAGMRDAAIELQLGYAHFHIGNVVTAEAPMRRAVALEPDNGKCHIGLARVLFAQQRFDEAEPVMKRALELCPGDFECLWILGNCRLCRSDPMAAEAYFRLAIASDPERSVAWKDLGAALDAQGRRKEAIEASATAARLDGKPAERGDGFVNLAIQLADDGQNAAALSLLETMLPQRPYAYGHLAYSQALLKAGRLEEGWHHYEFRFLNNALFPARQGFGRPVWAGQYLHGKTILLLAEQGLGDTIQFIRYATQLKALGASVLLKVSAGFEAFARGFPGVDRVLEPGATYADFDYYLHIVSLPYAFGTDLASIPAANACLRAEPDREARWKVQLASCAELKVGLVWAGNPNHVGDRYRSMSLADLAPLGRLRGVQFFALQKGAREEEAGTPPVGLSPVNLGPQLGDFCETAAAISQLDLVLSVDTAVAHLAGAMGKQVWMMLPKCADWRWLEGRDDSPWYPTMRLFRQHRQGQWDDVIERVRGALLEQVTKAAVPPAALSRAPSRLEANPGARSPPTSGMVHRAGFSAVALTRFGALQYLPDQLLIGESLRLYGELLQPQLDLLVPMLGPAATVLEVGSGIGAHAIFIAAAIGGEGHLMLYEPQPVLRQILRQNLNVNRVGNVTLMRGVLAGSGSDDRARDGGAGTAHTARGEWPNETVDELRLERLDLIKVDAAVDVRKLLAGTAATLWRLRPSLFIGMLDDARMAESAAHLREFGYRCWRVETPWFNPKNFNGRDADLFAGRKAVALLAIPEEREVSMAQGEWVELS